MAFGKLDRRLVPQVLPDLRAGHVRTEPQVAYAHHHVQAVAAPLHLLRFGCCGPVDQPRPQTRGIGAAKAQIAHIGGTVEKLYGLRPYGVAIHQVRSTVGARRQFGYIAQLLQGPKRSPSLHHPLPHRRPLAATHPTAACLWSRSEDLVSCLQPHGATFAATGENLEIVVDPDSRAGYIYKM